MADRAPAPGLVAVSPPPTPVFRIAHRPGDPFEPPPWSRARPDGTFGGRFDDPGRADDRSGQERYRVVYCAQQRAGAFGETIARFRPSLDVLAAGADPAAQAIAAARRDLTDPEDPSRGLIPVEWRLQRQIGATVLDPALRFVDLAAAETMQALREALAPLAVHLGLPDLDLGAVVGPRRRLTQASARFVYEQEDEPGRPRFVGVRYLSRLNPAWVCWAVFSGRMRHLPGPPEPIFPDDPGLLEAAATFGLTVESFAGHYVRPWLR